MAEYVNIKTGAIDKNVPTKETLKAELDKKFDKTGGTISGNVYIYSSEGATPICLEAGSIGFGTINGINGAYFLMENRSSDLNKPVISFYGNSGSGEAVTLANIENPTYDLDAANKQYVDSQSAYAAAQAGGYTDTQANFYADLAAMQGLASALAAI